MIARLGAWVVGGAVALAGSTAMAGCGDDPEPCEIDSGTFHIALPEEPDGAPIVMFLHGYGGNGGGTIRNQRLVAPLVARGYAVIAPNGLRRDGTGPSSWQFLPGFGTRDEGAFFTEVVAEASARFGTSDRVMLSGFSAGGFMVSYLACAEPETFAAYAPVAGGFWRPHPEGCAGPVTLLHTHGWMDRTVPLEGRQLGGGRFQQGDIWIGMDIWRQTNGCTQLQPDSATNEGTFWRRSWTECEAGALEFLLWPGGHTLPEGWADLAADWFERTVPAE